MEKKIYLKVVLMLVLCIFCLNQKAFATENEAAPEIQAEKSGWVVVVLQIVPIEILDMLVVIVHSIFEEVFYSVIDAIKRWGALTLARLESSLWAIFTRSSV